VECPTEGSSKLGNQGKIQEKESREIQESRMRKETGKCTSNTKQKMK
jgi:hypothetical protein